MRLSVRRSMPWFVLKLAPVSERMKKFVEIGLIAVIVPGFVAAVVVLSFGVVPELGLEFGLAPVPCNLGSAHRRPLVVALESEPAVAALV